MTVRTLTAAVAAILVLTACGGDDPAGEAATPSAGPTASPAAEATEAEASEPAESADDANAKTKNYRIQEGDTLSEIAQRFDTSVKALVRLNDLKDQHHIRAGQTLKIPAGE